MVAVLELFDVAGDLFHDPLTCSKMNIT